jgi:MYXO-CTERM domain-containing protein
MATAGAELYRTQAHFYGRFDARIQYAPGDGVVSTFFLWKEGSDAANAYWNELDYEKIAADCHMQLNNIYGNPETQHQVTPSMGFAMCEGYHDYRIEWTPTYIAWIVDGKEIHRDTGADATAYAQNATAGMTIHFNLWVGNSSFGGNINNTKLPVHQYISWVQYSSYDNGNFTVQWREEFDGSGVPSGWATGNWASPFNLSTHNPQNVAFVNGIAVLSLTADNATGNPGTPPVDPNASTGTGGSPGTGGTTSTGGGSGGTTSSTSGAGGTTGTGGRTGTGGTTSPTSSGGTMGSGGGTATGGRTSTTSSGGTSGLGGTSSATSSGGATTPGGTTGSGGTTAAGGRGGAGGTTATTSSGGASGSGGSSPSGGATGSGGTPATGGSIGAGGATASGGTTATSTDGTGGTPGTTATDGGCSCSTAPVAHPPWLVLMALSLAVLLLRRKEI